MVALVVFKSLDLDWLTSIITKQPLVSQTGDTRLSHRHAPCLTCSTPAFVSELLVQTMVLEGGSG